MVFPAKTNYIVGRLSASNTDEQISLLMSLGKEDNDENLETYLVELLKDTPDFKIRNAAAVALADIQSTKSATVISEKILEPSTKTGRATLLYALGEMQVPIELEFIVDVLLDSIYNDVEACEECIHLLENNNIIVDRENKDQQTRRLSSTSLKVRDEHRRDLLQEAEEIIESLKGPAPTLLL